MWLLKEKSDKWRNFIAFYSRFSCWQSQMREKKERRKKTEEMFLWKFSFAWIVDAIFLCSATLILRSVLVFMYSFSLEMYLFFCLKCRRLGRYFSWWSGVWSIKWLMQENICFLHEAHIDIQIVRHMSVRKMQNSVIFFSWYWTPELTFCFWYIPTVLQSYALKEIVWRWQSSPPLFQGWSQYEVLQGKGDLTQNIHLHLHLL